MEKMAHLLGAFNAELPLERASTPPPTWYFDSEIYRAEQELFRRTWQLVGGLATVEKPGDFFTTEICGEPLLVMRGNDGELRAFSNVCRHKAATILTSSGNTSRLQCRYHGWTYDLTGKLIGTPEWRGVCDFEKSSQCLPAFELQTWGPFIFVRLEKSEQTLLEYLSPLTDQNPAIGKMKMRARKEYTLRCNWKVFVDNYLDGGYHVNTLHPALATVLDYSNYKIDLFPESSLQSSPTVGNTAASSVRGGMAYYWWLFPNLMINLYENTLDTNMVLPLGEDRCRVIFDYYFAESVAPEFIAKSIEVAHQVQMEDQDICERVQRGLKSRYYPSGRYSVEREKACHAFHQILSRKLLEICSR
jgi:choline monooxygenase